MQHYFRKLFGFIVLNLMLCGNFLLFQTEAYADFGYGSSNDYVLDEKILEISFEKFFEQSDLIFEGEPVQLKEARPSHANSSYCYLEFRVLHWYKKNNEHFDNEILPIVFEKSSEGCPIKSKEPYLIFAPAKDADNGYHMLINPALYPPVSTASLLRDALVLWNHKNEAKE